MTTPFWQSNSLIKTTVNLISHYFGESLRAKKGLIVAKVVNESAGLFTKKTLLEQQVWLHENLFKVTNKLLDPEHKLINGNLGTLPKEIEGLANLQIATHLLQSDLREQRSREQEISYKNTPA